MRPYRKVAEGSHLGCFGYSWCFSTSVLLVVDLAWRSTLRESPSSYFVSALSLIPLVLLSPDLPCVPHIPFIYLIIVHVIISGRFQWTLLLWTSFLFSMSMLLCPAFSPEYRMTYVCSGLKQIIHIKVLYFLLRFAHLSCISSGSTLTKLFGPLSMVIMTMYLLSYFILRIIY